MRYDVITIGSGLGGLLSATLLAKRGKKVLLLEQHRIPGGYCTSYKRKGFTFNVPSVMSDIRAGKAGAALADLGLFDRIEWTEIDKFAKYVYPNFELVMLANDLAASRDSVLGAFPGERRAIDQCFSDIETIRTKAAMLMEGKRSLRNILSLIAALPRFVHLMRISFYDYVRQLTDNERLITVLASHWGYGGLPPKRIPALNLLMLSAECYGKPVMFPRDGFQAVPDLLAQRLVEFGGEIAYRTGVARILVDRKKALGVETTNGQRFFADTIISNADTKKTFLDMVGRSQLSRRFVAKVEAHTTSFSGVSVHIGTDLDLSKLDLRYGGIFCSESWDSGDSFFERAVTNRVDFCSDKIAFGLQAPSLLSPRLSPAGRHSLHILVSPVAREYDGGFRMREGRRGKEYRQAKAQLAEALIGKVERLVPGLSRSVVVTEVATPFTFERYTGATGGAWYDGVHAVGDGWRRPSQKTPIKSLLLTGTKAFGGGGMPPALLGGFETANAVLGGRA